MGSIRNEDLLALQSYITANDSTQYNHHHKDTLLLDLTHSNLIQRHIEIRFDKHSTVSTLRAIIHQKSGTAPCFQHLRLRSSSYTDTVLTEIPPDSPFEQHPLGFFNLESGMNVHCVDLDPYSNSAHGRYEDVSLVEKYRMSDEEYDQRKGTLRDWERQQKARDETFTLAKHAREHREKHEAVRQHKQGLPLPEGWEWDDRAGTAVRSETAEAVTTTTTTTEGPAEYGPESVRGIQVGMRCQINPGGRRGEVRFVGEADSVGSGGWWVGVRFDEPVGKGDGTAPDGTRHFDAAGPGYGGFCRGKNVETGDFPEADLFADDDSDSEDEL